MEAEAAPAEGAADPAVEAAAAPEEEEAAAAPAVGAASAPAEEEAAAAAVEAAAPAEGPVADRHPLQASMVAGLEVNGVTTALQPLSGARSWFDFRPAQRLQAEQQSRIRAGVAL